MDMAQCFVISGAIGELAAIDSAVTEADRNEWPLTSLAKSRPGMAMTVEHARFSVIGCEQQSDGRS